MVRLDILPSKSQFDFFGSSRKSHFEYSNELWNTNENWSNSRRCRTFCQQEIPPEKPRNSVELDLVSLPILKDVSIKNMLGSGNFGEVYRGEWKVRNFTEISNQRDLMSH